MTTYEIVVLGNDMEEMGFIYVDAYNSTAALEIAFQKACEEYGAAFHKVIITEEYIDGKRKH